MLKFKNVKVCTKGIKLYSLDVRVLDYDDPKDIGDTGSKCILARNETDGSILVEHDEKYNLSCQSYICAGKNCQSLYGSNHYREIFGRACDCFSKQL